MAVLVAPSTWVAAMHPACAIGPQKASTGIQPRFVNRLFSSTVSCSRRFPLSQMSSASSASSIYNVIDFSVPPEKVKRRRALINRRRNIVERDEGVVTKKLIQKCLGEAVGTAFILLCGTLATSCGLGVGPMSLVWGTAVGTGVLAFSSLSGAHFNPAVTVALTLGNKLRVKEAPYYIGAQYAGATIASAALTCLGWYTFPGPPGTLSDEAAITTILMYSCLAIGDGVESGAIKRRAAPMLVGLLIASLNLAFAPLGAGLNPALSAAPRLVAACSSIGGKALSGAAAFTIGPCIGGMLGGAIFALGSGRGDGIYQALSSLGRATSPYYGEHWTRLSGKVVPTLRTTESGAASAEPRIGMPAEG